MTALAAAFADAPAASQSVFRAVMNAMARPGTVQPLEPALAPPPPLSRGAGAVALTLIDFESPLWLDETLAASPEVAEWLRFHTGAPITLDPRRATFALIADAADAPSLEDFALGSEEYPDRSTTLVLQLESFAAPTSLRLSGPGIAGTTRLAIKPRPDALAQNLARNRALYPRGVDLLLVTADAVAALPRSLRVTEG